MTMLGVSLGLTRRRGGASAPAVTYDQLFASGETGAVYDAQIASSMFSATNASAQAVADGAVALIMDQSQGGLGANQFTNSDFSASGTGWTVMPSTTVDFSGGNAAITATAGVQGIYQTITLASGVQLFVGYTLAANSGGSNMTLIAKSGTDGVAGSTAFGVPNSAVGSYQQLVTTASPVESVAVRSTAAMSFTVDDPFIRLAPGAHATQGTGGNQPLLKAGGLNYVDFDGVDDAIGFTLPTNSETDWTRALQAPDGSWTYLEGQSYTGAQTLSTDFARVIYINRALTNAEKAGLEVAYPAPDPFDVAARLGRVAISGIAPALDFRVHFDVETQIGEVLAEGYRPTWATDLPFPTTGVGAVAVTGPAPAFSAADPSELFPLGSYWDDLGFWSDDGLWSDDNVPIGDFGVTTGVTSVSLAGISPEFSTSVPFNVTPGVSAVSAVGVAPTWSAISETLDADYFVSPTGNDSNNGTSISTPWRTWAKTQTVDFNDGDIIEFADGTYNEWVQITKGGTGTNRVIYRAANKHGAIINPPFGWSTVVVETDSVEIDGFEIVGQGGDGVDIVGQAYVSVKNCLIHGATESGIQWDFSEFCIAEGNTIYGCCSSGWYSGISVYQCRNITGDTTTEGFRTIVRNNLIYNNVTVSGDHGDGNGIIIDDYQHTQTTTGNNPAGTQPNYTYPTLVEGNVCYGNGGKGIQVFVSDYVTVRNNTCYKNSQDNLNPGTWRGEISASFANNCKFANNIAWCDKARYSGNDCFLNDSTGTNVGNSYVANISFTGTPGVTSLETSGGAIPTAGNYFGINPLFTNTATLDFTLQATSPALNASSPTYGLPTTDIAGTARPQGAGVDIGAYERA